MLKARRQTGRKRWVSCLTLLLSLAACTADPELPTARPMAVLAHWNGQDQAAEPMLPYQLEIEAEVLALARTTAVEQRDGRAVLGLQIEETLKGAVTAAALFPADAQPWFGCIVPERIPRPSELFPTGSEVLVYLSRDAAGTIQILSLQQRPQQLAPLRRFLALYAAAREADPDWEQLWPSEELGLDTAGFYALGGGGRLLPTLRAPLQQRLETTVTRLREGQTSVDPERLQLLVGLVNRYQLVEALPSLAELLEWTLERSPADNDNLRGYQGSLLPDRRLLTHASATQAVRWRALLERVLQAGDLRASQQACFALAALPDDLGFPLLLRELQAQRLATANALYHWLSELRPPEHVAALEQAVTTLLRQADRSDERQLTFARHLKTIAARLAQRDR